MDHTKMQDMTFSEENRIPISTTIFPATNNWIIKISFWAIFALNYLYLNHLLLVVTNNEFRYGQAILGFCLLAIVFSLKIVKNTFLGITLSLLIVVSILSALVNSMSLLQVVAFIRIPVSAYLIYNLVWYYINSVYRIKKVLKLLSFIAIFQLPIIIIQRVLYPYLPDRFLLDTTLVDFGMGTFNGDTAMAFALIGLVVLLLFDSNVRHGFKRNWLIAGWLTLTVLFSNSQVQHFTIIIIWFIYLLIQMKPKTILIALVVFAMVLGFLAIMSYSGWMTFPILTNSIEKLSEAFTLFKTDVDYSQFLEGKHARGAAMHYYTHQPIRWIGTGPGSIYDTATETRTVGGWGHIFTFYAEVGIVGLILSYMFFFFIAFPLRISVKNILVRKNWVATFIFTSVILVSLVKYPMGNASLLFTYCIILVSHHKLRSFNKLMIQSQIYDRAPNPE